MSVDVLKKSVLFKEFTPTGLGFASEVPDATFTVYGLTDETLDDWDEATIRWANAPANRPGGASPDPDRVVKLGSFEMVQGVLTGTRSISGPVLAEFLNRDTNGLATFILVRDTRGSGRSDLVHGLANKHHPTLPPPTLKLKPPLLTMLWPPELPPLTMRPVPEGPAWAWIAWPWNVLVTLSTAGVPGKLLVG